MTDHSPPQPTSLGPGYPRTASVARPSGCLPDRMPASVRLARGYSGGGGGVCIPQLDDLGAFTGVCLGGFGGGGGGSFNRGTNPSNAKGAAGGILGAPGANGSVTIRW